MRRITSSAPVAAVAAALACAVAAHAARAPDAATAVACGKTRPIGLAIPLTGQAAPLGLQQLSWARFYVNAWNAGHATKYRLVTGDTRLPDPAQALAVAQKFVTTRSILGVVGPADSQEVQETKRAFWSGGLAYVSGSATSTSLAGTKGFFFRVVPNDDQQAPDVANFMLGTLKVKNVFVVDDQEAYSQTLADAVQKLLEARSVKTTRDSVSQTATDFSSLIATIPAGTDVIYIPWQLSAEAQAFGEQLKAQGKDTPLFGSEGLFDPGTFTIPGSYDSFIPLDLASPLLKVYAEAHRGKLDYLGAPTYVATQVVVAAIERACAAGKGQTTRRKVRSYVAGTRLQHTLLGPVSFTPNGDLVAARYAIYRIDKSGAYRRVR